MGGGVFYMVTNNHVMQGGRKSFTNAFSSNMNTKSENGGRHTWKINPDQSIGSWKDLSLRFMLKRFQRPSQGQFPSC